MAERESFWQITPAFAEELESNGCERTMRGDASVILVPDPSTGDVMVAQILNENEEPTWQKSPLPPGP